MFVPPPLHAAGAAGSFRHGCHGQTVTGLPVVGGSIRPTGLGGFDRRPVSDVERRPGMERPQPVQRLSI